MLIGVNLEGPARVFSLRKCCGSENTTSAIFSQVQTQQLAPKRSTWEAKIETEVIALRGVACHICGNTQLIDTLKVRACADMFLGLRV